MASFGVDGPGQTPVLLLVKGSKMQKAKAKEKAKAKTAAMARAAAMPAHRLGPMLMLVLLLVSWARVENVHLPRSARVAAPRHPPLKPLLKPLVTLVTLPILSLPLPLSRGALDRLFQQTLIAESVTLWGKRREVYYGREKWLRWTLLLHMRTTQRLRPDMPQNLPFLQRTVSRGNPVGQDASTPAPT